jgi:hypothetical protein
LFLTVCNAAFAQTNAIIFPQLLSPSNAVLMTNAEFRCINGSKIFFKNDAGYQSFACMDLSTNVLNALGTSVGKLDAQQKALDDAKANYKTQSAAWNVERARQAKLAAEKKAADVAHAKEAMALVERIDREQNPDAYRAGAQ